jgi:glutamate synthase domain-containing protein 2
VPDGTYQYQVATAGTVTIQVTNGAMSLGSVSTSAGWTYAVEKNRSDDVEVEFENGEAEASIRVKADHGELDVEIEAKSG